MKPLSFLFIVALLSSSFAAPLEPGSRRGGHQLNRGLNLATVSGAAYFISNEPGENNFVVTANIAPNGELSLARAFRTGGKGSRGVTDPVNSPDPLFSQGSVVTSSNGSLLAAVNPGSNSISLFAIDQRNPSQLRLLGKPVSSGGEFPVSLAFNPVGDQLCALNGGAKAGVACFLVSSVKGMRACPSTSFRSLDLNQTTPPAGPAKTASHILFSEDGTQVIAMIKGAPDAPGHLAVWDVDAKGTLSEKFTAVPPPAGGALPFGSSLIPGTNALIATDPAVGFTVIDLKDQTKSSAIKVDGQGAVCWIQRSKATGNFYMTDIATSLVTEVNVDKNLNATIVKQYPQGDGFGTIDNKIVSLSGKDFMFVNGANATTINVMSLDAPGQAKIIQQFDMSPAAEAAGFKLNGFNIQGMAAVVMAD
ncbi:hypothetical protein BT69DRAFT_1353571 [Atractiella rhizophila]|nr:hypothetical protein BT69DRAFT_1353571 [Atractiella rhizophila]